jgi:homoserine kinase type II
LKDRVRETFEAEELAVALSHYDLGVIESITEFTRGSRRSPKVGIVSQKGKFLLKRRDPTRTSPNRVEFCHALQSHLIARAFPLPRIVSPVDANGSCRTVLRLRNRTYELFEYVSGHTYRGLDSETHDAGRTLATFHRLTSDFQFGADRPTGDYHDANAVRTGLNTIPSAIDSHESVLGKQAELLGATSSLYDAYDDACEHVRDWGLDRQPERVIHSDWHPGNMLFKNGQVAAVIDYDSARFSRRVLDVANGMLQFSILSGAEPETWPEHLDEAQANLFLSGYEEVEPLDAMEYRCIPYLMIEALIAETVLPVAMTGAFGKWHGFRFMQMVCRKVRWLRQNAPRLTDALVAGKA